MRAVGVYVKRTAVLFRPQYGVDALTPRGHPLRQLGLCLRGCGCVDERLDVRPAHNKGGRGACGGGGGVAQMGVSILWVRWGKGMGGGGGGRGFEGWVGSMR